jgi:hypothetical protein
MFSLLVLLIPVTFLTIRSTKFCEACGQVTRTPFFLKPATKCSHCQKPL